MTRNMYDVLLGKHELRELIICKAFELDADLIEASININMDFDIEGGIASKLQFDITKDIRDTFDEFSGNVILRRTLDGKSIEEQLLEISEGYNVPYKRLLPGYTRSDKSYLISQAEELVGDLSFVDRKPWKTDNFGAGVVVGSVLMYACLKPLLTGVMPDSYDVEAIKLGKALDMLNPISASVLGLIYYRDSCRHELPIGRARVLDQFISGMYLK